MEQLLLKILNMSYAASWLVLAVLILRLALKKAPRWIHVLLWAMVGIRLVCPFSWESVLSLLPSAEVVSPQILYDAEPVIHTGIAGLDNAVNPAFTQTFAPESGESANPLQVWTALAGGVWLAGIAAMGLYTLVSYLRLRRKVWDAVRLEGKVYQSGRIQSPFVLGLFAPRIYLPSALQAADRDYVMAHERAHIRRRDHWWKPLGFTLLAVHWFNPLMWIAYILLCRDIELACDEKVIRSLGDQQRADYSQALLSCSVSRRSIAACPLAFGEVGVKERVKSILSYKKPGFWILLGAVAACVAVAVCFLTDPKEETQRSYSDRILCVGVRNSDGSVMEEDVKWYYYNLRRGETVTLPGDTTLEISIESVKEDTATLQFSALLRREGEQLQELLLEPGHWEELYAGDPGGSTQYTFINMARPTDTNGAVFTWIESTKGIREAQTVIMAYFPGVTFHYDKSSVWCEGEGLERWIMFEGMPVQNVYFADLSGDGLPEVCATVSWGSGMIDTYVEVADFVTGELFYIRDRGIYDYNLVKEDERLVCVVTEYSGGEEIKRGQLTIAQAAGGSGRKLILTESGAKDEADIGGADGPETVTEGTDLTLAAVLSLSEKGRELTWEDLEGYNGTEVGSGLYIMQYPIDEAYYLLAASGGPGEELIYACLCVRYTDLLADIRTEDVVAFIEESRAAVRDIMISDAILDHNEKEEPDGLVHTVSYRIIDSVKVSGTPVVGSQVHQQKETVYLNTMYTRYSPQGAAVNFVDGRYVPAIVVFAIDEYGAYTVEEYWEPRTGLNREKDILSRFPEEIAEEALNAEPYMAQLEKQCYDKALEMLYQNGALIERMAYLLTEIQSSPAYSSAPGDYIAAHPAEYQELLSYGEQTLEYCFGKFLDGGQTGLEGHIMAIACEEIMAAWGEAYDIEPVDRMTGQAWFAHFRSLVTELDGQLARREIEEKFPGAAVLLRYIG